MQRSAMTAEATVVAPDIRPLRGSWLRRAGSLRITLVILPMLAAGVLLAYEGPAQEYATWALVLPLTLLAGNLMAAIATHPAFRRQGALLVFHLALLALVLLVAASRLCYLKGTAEVLSGGEFAGLKEREAGPWHRDRTADLRFESSGFTIAYKSGLRRAGTHNRVRWRDGSGLPHEQTVGDQEPLVLDGYRFYTTHHKGFAPVFAWNSGKGPTEVGSVHLPAYPEHEHRQWNEWHPPGLGQPVWIQLVIEETLLDPSGPTEFRVPAGHHLVIRHGDRRLELRPGESANIGGGELRYVELRTWMGYAVFHDWTVPWLLATCALAVLSLAWHVRCKHFSRPWRPDDHGELRGMES